MEAYKNWVRTNRHFVSSIENLAHMMTWLLPERFSASEIGPEAVASLVGLITAVNTHIIESLPQHSEIGGSGQQVGGQASFQQDLSFPWSLCISAVKEVEVLVEVAAEHYFGKDEKWSFVAASEAVKALLRLILLHKSGYRMLLNGEAPVDVDGSSKLPESINSMVSDRFRYGRTMLTNWEMHPSYNSHTLEGSTRRAFRKFGEQAQEDCASLFSRGKNINGFMDHRMAAMRSHKKETVAYSKALGEALFILRPLIYVLLIKRCGVRSWKPWFVSLALDISGMTIYSRLSSRGQTMNGKHFTMSKVEKQELKRRQLMWVLYVMRDPFFCKYTRHRLERSERFLKPVPLLGHLAAKAVELLIGVQTRYSYISAS